MGFYSTKDERREYEIHWGRIVLTCFSVLILYTIFEMAVMPRYRVWERGMAGQAQIMQAEQNRKIKGLEAQARLDSAGLEAQAEVARAEGVAKANKIVAEGLGGPEGYLRYLYIHMLEGQQNQIIYLPTEAGLPILEAGKR